MNTLTKYSVSDAANLYQKSRATLYKDIKNGNLSRDQDGLIDFSELLRVYGEPLSNKKVRRIQVYSKQQHNTSENNHDTVQDLKHQIAFLKQQLDKAEHREAQANSRIDTLLTLIEMKPNTSNLVSNESHKQQEAMHCLAGEYDGLTTNEELQEIKLTEDKPVKRGFLSRFFD